MKYLFWLVITFPCICIASSTEQEALRKAAEALSKTKTVKKYAKDAEKMLYRMIPVERETAATIGSIGLTIIKGEINTSDIKNLDIKFMGGKLRPNFKHNFNDGEVAGNVKINWQW